MIQLFNGLALSGSFKRIPRAGIRFQALADHALHLGPGRTLALSLCLVRKLFLSSAVSR